MDNKSPSQAIVAARRSLGRRFGTTAKARNRFYIEAIHPDGSKNIIECPNLVMTLGFNSLLDTMFREATQVANWYIGLIDNESFTEILIADTLASHAGWVEFTDYADDRKAWAPDAADAGSIENSTLREFSCTDTGNVRGAFIASVDTGTSGLLWCAAEFAAVQPVVNGTKLNVRYTVNLSNA